MVGTIGLWCVAGSHDQIRRLPLQFRENAVPTEKLATARCIRSNKPCVIHSTIAPLREGGLCYEKRVHPFAGMVGGPSHPHPLGGIPEEILERAERKHGSGDFQWHAGR